MKKSKIILLAILILTIIIIPKDTKAVTLKEYEDAVEKYTKELKEKEAKIARGKEEIEKVKKNIAETEGKIEEAEKEIERLQQEIEECNIKIEQKNNESKKIMEYYQGRMIF